MSCTTRLAGKKPRAQSRQDWATARERVGPAGQSLSWIWPVTWVAKAGSAIWSSLMPWTDRACSATWASDSPDHGGAGRQGDCVVLFTRFGAGATVTRVGRGKH